MGYIEESTDELIMHMARGGYEDAIAEARKRGLEIPAPVDTSPDEIPEYYSYTDTLTDEETPREGLPMGALIELIADGDVEAARVLHERYPYLYDEAGQEIDHGYELPG